MSAGNYWSYLIFSRSDGLRSFHSTSCQFPDSSSLIHLLELLFLSLRYLLKSSQPSLVIDNPITNMRAIIAEYGSRGEITGMHCRRVEMRKYMLAYLLNCLSKANGKKVNMLYLVVETQFDGYAFDAGAGTSKKYVCCDVSIQMYLLITKF